VFAEVISPKITKKIGSDNRKSAKCHICERSANISNYLSLQICEFASCGIYLRKALLCCVVALNFEIHILYKYKISLSLKVLCLLLL